MGIISAVDLCKSFVSKEQTTHALKNVSFDIKENTLTCLVGADGAGKTTLLRLIAHLFSIDSGQLNVLNRKHMQDFDYICNNVSYMPQKFGLYEDLTIQENINLYADLYGISNERKISASCELLKMAGLKNFESRQAGRLSGGMKQKLALVCSLLRIPKILILDEPTVGVDPLSRKELWEIIRRLVKENNMTVIVSSSYMDEAELSDYVLMLHEGELIAGGTPFEIKKYATGKSFFISGKDLFYNVYNDTYTYDIVPSCGGIHFLSQDPSGIDNANPVQPSVEDGFISILTKGKKRDSTKLKHSDKILGNTVIKAENLTKKFGEFTAVKSSSFTVNKGEIFGLLGPNGAGKTTTFRMMCGLLAPTSGLLQISGIDASRAAIEVRKKLGYMAQKFSLYSDLNVMENLDFFASVYGLNGSKRKHRIDEVLDEFDLKNVTKAKAGELPGGYKQRLAMAVSLIHKPEILFLDEPTSGADPLARREFWKRILELSANSTTVVVTTHFMEEAEYCDRIMIQDMGEMLVIGTPDEVRHSILTAGNTNNSMQDAFIAIIEKSRSS